MGYFAAARHLAKALTEVHHGLTICAPAVSQHAALAALDGPQDCVEEMRRTYDERRRIMCRALDRMGLTYGRPRGAFYVYANVSSTGLAASEFCVRLLEDARVMIFPGRSSATTTTTSSGSRSSSRWRESRTPSNGWPERWRPSLPAAEPAS